MMKNRTDEYGLGWAAAKAIPPALEDAYGFLLNASQRGDQRAIYALATWYLFGNHVVQKDEAQGVSMLLSLKDSYIAEAIYDLAIAYDNGWGVDQDDKIAFSLYMRAALLGNKESCNQISQFYAEGLIVDFDENLSKAWQIRSEQDEVDISPPYRLWLEPSIQDVRDAGKIAPRLPNTSPARR